MISPEHIHARLTGYLGGEAQPFRVLASGWETTVFEFALRSSPPNIDLPAGRPLVLRFYHGPDAASKGGREYEVMKRLRSAAFPVPAPYAFEADSGLLGAPFLIMERLEGEPLLRLKSFPEALKVFTLAFLPFVRLHTRLHRLAPDSLGVGRFGPALNPPQAASTPLLQRMLTTIAGRVARGQLAWLQPALGWAQREAAKFAQAPASVLHMDYHPLNVLVGRQGRISGVIDWVSADTGDRHLDVATTATILSCHAMEHPRWLRDNLAGNSLRRLYGGLYVALYRSLMPLEFARLRYCQAVASIMRLSTLGMMIGPGAEAVGYRAEAATDVTQPVLQLLARYASRKSGIRIMPPQV